MVTIPCWKGSQWARDSCRSSGASCSDRGTPRGRRYRLEAWNLNVNDWYNVGRSRPGIYWCNVGGWTSGINVNYIKRVPCFFQIWQWLSKQNNIASVSVQIPPKDDCYLSMMKMTVITYQWWRWVSPINGRQLLPINDVGDGHCIRMLPLITGQCCDVL